VADYLKAYERRGGKAVYETQRAAETHILPGLGTTPVGKLTAHKITDWHHGLAEKRARARTKPGRRQNYRKLETGPDDAVRKRRATANRILTVLMHFSHRRLITTPARRRNPLKMLAPAAVVAGRVFEHCTGGLTTMRAALYLRVSTTDQDTERQERELRAAAAARGWEVLMLSAASASASFAVVATYPCSHTT
jgi:Resolvase, N terminal domain